MPSTSCDFRFLHRDPIGSGSASNSRRLIDHARRIALDPLERARDITDHGLPLVGDFNTTILTGGHVLREWFNCSYIGHLWLVFMPLAAVPVLPRTS
jgi:hypothetical protein